jgi:AmpD protein|tara:strand:- start:76 stop:612 length:537 start_codon:yes stop_codon:yes gene_type:complete
MRIDPNTHLIVGVDYQCSPNADNRPEKTSIDLIVIHNISLPPYEFGTGCVQKFFANKLDISAHEYFEEIRDLHVSSHLFIERNGEVTQFVPFNKRAWHAGQSCFEGRPSCNDFSIGIELEGTDDIEYTVKQYVVLKAIILSLQMAYPSLSLGDLTGHSDIAPGRKTDPGPAFDWEKLN